MDKIKNSFIGHQGRCFDVRYCENGRELLSASEDGSAKLWDVNTRKCLYTFDHDKDHEVLRGAFLNNQNTRICTCGSDGNAIVWTADSSNISSSSPASDRSYVKALTISHGESQIYACETFPCVDSSQFLTAAENQVYLWDLSDGGRNNPLRTLGFDVCPSTTASPDSETFGGRSRNPDGRVYVFDVKSSFDPNGMLLALALSDGTVRMVDLRCHNSVSIFRALPSDESSSIHATSLCWSPDGNSVVSTLGNGGVTALDIRTGNKLTFIRKAHDRSCFGAVFQKSEQAPRGSSLFATWSSDCTIKTWDLRTLPQLIVDPTKNCVRESTIPDYPIYSATTSSCTLSDELMIGGGGNPSFLGTLIHTISNFA